MSGFVRLAKDGFSKFLKFIRFYQVRPQMPVNRRGAKSGFFAPIQIPKPLKSQHCRVIANANDFSLCY